MQRPRVEPLPDTEAKAALDPKPGPLPRAQRALSATWRLAILLVVVAGVGLVLAHSLRVYFAQSQEIAAVRADIAVKQEQIAELEDKLNRWNDPEYVRAVARVRLGWVMPGEVGYRVIGADGQPLDGASIEAPDPANTGLWWERMWGSVALADQPVEESAPKADPDRTVAPSPEPES
ncbi:FtsB family cell division protein [Tessaracoccus sp. Y1736]